MKLEPYIIKMNSTIIDALKKIDNNEKGFVIVLNDNGIIQGTVTDGDIRRSIINRKSVETPIAEVMSLDFSFVYEEDTFEKLIIFFKKSKIEFLPILNTNEQIINVLTKKQFHTVLLEGIEWDLRYDFSKLDNRTIDHEIYNRPWGYYKTVFLSDYSRAKVIQINPGEELSLQEHKKREEHWVIVKGEGEMIIGESMKVVSEGMYVYIPKGCKHRISNFSNENPLIISEVQLGSYFGEDDIIRYDDKYGRLEE